MYFADPPELGSLAPTPALRRIVMSSWLALAPWLEQLKELRFLGDDAWPSDLIARADGQAKRPSPTWRSTWRCFRSRVCTTGFSLKIR
jgi:hypothetical protein